MTDVVVSIASKAAEYLVAPVGRECGYAICCDGYVRQLIGEVGKLGDQRDEVQRSINEARNNTKPIKAKVEKWVKEVETVTNEVRNLLDHDGGAKKTCFCGWLPNPKARHRLGKEARKMIKDIQALIARGQFPKVYDENPPPGLVNCAPDGDVSPTNGGDTITDSRASIFQGIMEALNDEKHKVIGVYGPGGVGKTTLLEEVEKKLRNEGKGKPFQMIVKAKVSQTPDLKKIQDDIAYALGLDLKEPSEVGRRECLFRRLQMDPNEKVLIILDDLWDELDLKAVGIPSGDESSKCKLLLSSRIKDVLEQKMGADPTFRLEGLSKEEAFRLFEKTVGHRLKDDEELKPIAAQVVNKLAGLPLLINSVAMLLKNSKVGAWRNAAKKINAEEIETIVQPSYDHLKGNDIKALFLLCGLIGGTIKVETLLVLGMGMGLFEGYEETIQDSRDRLDTMLSELRSACLLLDGGDDKENVTIHDLYSEVVVSNPFRDKNSLIINDNCGTWPKKKLDKCRACLVDVGNDRFVELMPRRFPKAKILMLSGKNDMGDYSKKYFKDMKELRALCLCSRSITSLPSPIEILGNLRSLIINFDVEDVAILGKLKALQILSFAGSTISKLPKEIGELTKLRLLNLSNCDRLATGVLKGLINLEEIYMHGSFNHGSFNPWMGKDESFNAKLAELKSLTKLTALEISIHYPTVLLKAGDLPFGNLTRFWINIGNVKGRKFEGLRTMMLEPRGCDSLLSREWVQKTLHKTQHLHLIGLGEFKKSAHELCFRGFSELKHLDIDDSPSIEYIANSSSGLLLPAFKSLESLFLENLINLEKIWNGPVAPDSFSKLKVVHIVRCPRLKNLWFLSEMQRLVHLEEILVSECDSLQAIITDDGGKVEVAADDRVVFPNVRHLELSYLPNMLSFCTGADGAPIQVSFPRLESLVMVGLLDLEMILYSQPQLQYTNLKSIAIIESRSTSSILKSDWILKLPNLESLEIISCQSTEVVFDLEELKVPGHVEILSKLTRLTLSELPVLQHVWKHDVKLQGLSAFRNLKELNVSDTGLAFLLPISMAKCLGEITDIEVTTCPHMEAMIVDEEGRDEGTDDIIEFPKLERLWIRECPTEKFFSYSQDAYFDYFFDRKVSLPKLKELYLWGGSFKRIWHDELPRSSLCELATLNLDDCSELVNVFLSTVIGRLHNLKQVGASDCPLLKSLFDCGSLDPNTEQTRVLFPELEGVFVHNCPSLVSLFDFGSLDSNTEQTMVSVPMLEVLAVDGAKELRHVVKSDYQRILDFPEEEGSRSKGVVMSFPSLARITIRGCGNFGAFNWSPESPQPLFNEMVELPNIRSLRIEGAQCEELWNNQIPYDSFCKLEFLGLWKCDNLQYVVSSHMRKRLHRSLDILQVESCHSIEKIYEGDDTVMKSGKLRRLVLRDLEKLRHIWQSDGLPNVPFPCLRFVEVQSCPRLRMLFPAFTPEFLGQIKELVVVSCEDMELIAGHEECEEAVGTSITFSELTALGLFQLPKFRSFLPEKYSMEFPSLRFSRRVSCGTEPDDCRCYWEGYERLRVYQISLETGKY